MKLPIKIMIEKKTSKQEQLDKIVESKIKGIGLDALFHLVDASKKNDGSSPQKSREKANKNRLVERLKIGLQFLEPQNIKTHLQRIYSSRPDLILGISIDSAGIKIIELKDVRGTIRLDYVQFFPIPHTISTSKEKSEDFVINTVKESLDPLTIKNAYICSVIPRSKVIIKFFSLPAADPAEIEKMVELEAEHLVPFSLSECIFDYDVLYYKGGQSHLIFVIIKKDEITRHLQLLNKIGLKPSAVDISSIVLHNTLLWEKSLRGRIVHIYINPDHTDINIIEDGNLKTSRGIPWGSSSLTSGLAKKLNVNLEIATKIQRENGIVIKKTLKNNIADSISEYTCKWAQNLIAEINETIRHFQFQEGLNTIDKIILTGDGSRLLNLDEYLKDQTKTKVFIQEPPEAFKQNGTGEFLKKFYNELSVLTGLAGRFRAEESAKVNLLPHNLKFSYEQKTRGIKRLTTAYIAGAVLLMCLAFPAGIIEIRNQYIGYLDRKIAQLTPEAVSIQNLNEKVQTIEHYQSNTRSCIEILREISILVSLDVLINQFSFEQNDSVILVGEAGSHSSVVNLSRAVQESKLFDDAKLVYTKKEDRLENAVNFEIICKLSQ